MLKKTILLIALIIMATSVLAGGKVAISVEPATGTYAPGSDVPFTVSVQAKDGDASFYGASIYIVSEGQGKYLDFPFTGNDVKDASWLFGSKLDFNRDSSFPTLYGWWVSGYSADKLITIKSGEKKTLATFKAKVKADALKGVDKQDVKLNVFWFNNPSNPGGFTDDKGSIGMENVPSTITIQDTQCTPQKNTCNEGEACVFPPGKCSKGDPGEVCTKDQNICKKPMQCILDGKAVGFCGCNDNTQCPNDFKCNIVKKQCEPKGGENDKCTDSSQCKDPLKCAIKAGAKEGVCKKGGCSKDADCQNNQFCGLDNVCKDKKDGGKECTDDKECKSNKCDKTKNPPQCTDPASDADDDGDGVVNKFDGCANTPKTTKGGEKMWVYPEEFFVEQGKGVNVAGCQLGDLNADQSINMPDFLDFRGAIKSAFGSSDYNGPARIGIIKSNLEKGKKSSFPKGFNMPDFLEFRGVIKADFE
jgi:hypothetical protein